jgi:Fe-S-cluster containining protein
VKKIPVKSESTVLRELFTRMKKFCDNPHISNVKKVKRCHQAIDYYNELVGVHGDSVCEKGCSYCCNVNVTVFHAEVENINSVTGLSGEMKTGRSKDYTGQPCIFLNQGLCSIYNDRPVACRTFFSMDSVDYCADETNPKHVTTTAESSQFYVEVIRLISELSNGELCEIRDSY